MMFSSVIQWKKHHPTFECSLYADKMTLEVITQLGANTFWDNTTVLPKNNAVNKNVFWASSKLQVLTQIKEPTIIMDNDFVVYTNFKKFLNQQVVVSHIEDGSNYYIMPTDHFAKKVKHLLSRYKPTAVNCSFLYFPDYKFMNHYATTSLEIMAILTRNKAPNSKYLLVIDELHSSNIEGSPAGVSSIAGVDARNIKAIPVIENGVTTNRANLLATVFCQISNATFAV